MLVAELVFIEKVIEVLIVVYCRQSLMKYSCK